MVETLVTYAEICEMKLNEIGENQNSLDSAHLTACTRPLKESPFGRAISSVFSLAYAAYYIE